ncbi:MAG: hypothetical protein PF542_05010 [Nanoarchaeota archaeon]|jgi:hypothetical protein|nr:hypothetical protein [Nanoarchaeota archaeon]
MINKKELFAILSTTLVLATVISLLETWTIFFITAGIVLAVILINVIAKKIMGYMFQAEVEVSLWEFKRMIYYNPIKKTMHGHKPHHQMRNKFPAGFFMPLIIKFLSVGLINWMACLTFDVKATVHRAARKWEVFQYSQVTEQEMAWIAFMGIIANIFFAIIGYMINAPLFAKLNLTYAFFSSIPLGTLDGTKMYFGRRGLWVTAMVITSMGVVASMVIA